MEERIKLTIEQMELAKKFNELCREMTKQGIGFVNKPGSIYLINLNHVEDYVFPEEMNPEEMNPEDDFDEELIDFADMTPCDMDIFYASADCDDVMGIRFMQ